jgi:hypothetical protein
VKFNYDNSPKKHQSLASNSLKLNNWHEQFLESP